MLTIPRFTSNLLVQLNQATNRTFALPILIFFPTARCNSHCVSCDWWKADGAGDLTLDEIRALADQLPALRTRLVSFSGGEPTFRRDVYEIAALFRARGVRLHLLTSGLSLDRDAAAIVEQFGEITISLDGHTATLYEQIRWVHGLGAIERGVAKIKALAPRTPVRARSTLHRHNFTALPHLIDKAHAMGLDGISFLTADVTSEAFGRTSTANRRTASSMGGLLLNPDEVEEFARVVEGDHRFPPWRLRVPGSSPNRPTQCGGSQVLRRAARAGEFPPVRCNAPWATR
jgi:molybdenum cofactor biosynthesis enzyme MoaA